ncbi:MAG: hypothetical protein A2W90_00310 [Bacteroidetes bacterium GWF2_42_66]|nr:MAG: hypothetical protein A2W92_09490 [Bacteroidetes bacterium GWA2_42_15]OFX97855.1 MAG: hypothetical protein A2W89_07275 [Bacteroidetes bacterium GWE2_42_39]OFY44168.1 MAG: hypothetical protein A2W90_00310 [Bacteroidetes bacterium GWF2_42_66]HBL74584.1 hypothetical protein [Prolixibacteraceae bacterium]HCR91524.1 hypothetical protein [Prolixibacteraceae bacterium]
MKKLFLFVLVLSVGQAMAQFVSNPYSPTRIGDFIIQNGKIYYIKQVGMPFSPENYAGMLLKKNTPNEAIKVNMNVKEGLKGTFTNYPLDWASTGFKLRKIESFLLMPFNATFEIEKQTHGYVLKVTNIWFNDSNEKRNLTLEDIVLSKGGNVFSKEKQEIRSLSILNMNLNEVFMPQMTF